MFDPEAEGAFWLAQDIVGERVTASREAYAAAVDYVEAWEDEQDSPTWPPTATPAEWGQSVEPTSHLKKR